MLAFDRSRVYREDVEHAEERWKPVVGHEGCYEVSDLGRVRSLDRTITRNGLPVRLRGRMLRQYTRDKVDNRYSVTLAQGDQRRVHHLVLEAFIGPRPDGLIGCHNDGNCQNNKVANLRWGTYSSNARDQIKHGTHSESSKVNCLRGHALQDPNLSPWWAAREIRRCLACERARVRIRSRGQGDIQAESDAEYGAILAGKVAGFITHQCPRGHPFTPENTLINKSKGWRVCRTCKRESGLRSDAKRRITRR
jgi:hypothetical protein